MTFEDEVLDNLGRYRETEEAVEVYAEANRIVSAYYAAFLSEEHGSAIKSLLEHEEEP